jgi:hypothetical protein
MSFVIFQMWGPFRERLIESHTFYVNQAKDRLLSRFDNIEDEAKKAADEYLERNQYNFDPERHDPSDFYDRAFDVGFEFYELLNDMKKRTHLSVVAGMYHELDKQLRGWLVKEIAHWHHEEHFSKVIWKVDIARLFDLLSSIGCDVKSQHYFQHLDACRLVVNVYKHGNGQSFDELKQKYPQYLEVLPIGDPDYRNHEDVKITDIQFEEISAAIIAFWQSIPENVLNTQIVNPPQWFIDAYNKN